MERKDHAVVLQNDLVCRSGLAAINNYSTL